MKRRLFSKRGVRFMDKIMVNQITKAYNQRLVLDHVSYVFEKGHAYCIMGKSGVGKTTLLRIIAGLEKADAGQITGVGNTAMVFQEDRLIDRLSAVDNVKLVLPGRNNTQDIVCQLLSILPQSCIDQPVSGLSGGMRRRAALVRAVMAPADTLILDEPFNGLDAQTKDQVIQYIRTEQRGRTLICVTHEKDDAVKLGAEICVLTRD